MHLHAPLSLNERTLARHAARVSVPAYDRAALRRGVVHIGVGSFHRAHQAVYFDELARRGLADGWALTGIGLCRRDMKDALAAQDGLYTVLTRGEEGEDARIVGVITRYLFAPEETEAVLGALAHESTRLVTLTVTANGYQIDPETSLPASTGEESPEPTALGLLVEALDRRRRHGRAPFTVLSCDNLAGNGAIARMAVLALAARRDKALAGWIAQHGAFPSSMVDRITPGTTEADQLALECRFGVRDRWPVVTEPYSQWVVEDWFCAGRPPLDRVGVQFVADVRPYALMKTRLLNGTHCALAYLGLLAGYERTDQAMADPVFAAYTERLMSEEIAPLLPPVDADLDAYCATLHERLANRAIADRLTRLARNGSLKVPAHLIASIREARVLGRPHGLLTLAVSAWCRYLRGEWRGRCLPLEDPDGERLQGLAVAGGGDPRPLLADERLFGSLGQRSGFAERIARDLRRIENEGPRAAMAARTAPAPLPV